MATDVRESEVKNRLKKDYFDAFDWTRVIGDIDLAVCSQPRLGEQPVTFLWAETKKGSRDYYESLIQLILTIGKAKTYEREIPPFFLGAADARGIAFVAYSDVMHIFTKTDFNWNVTPSDHNTKEFSELYSLLKDELAKTVVFFKYAYDSDMLKKWIKKNFKEGRKSSARIPVNKNNFTFVYYDWVKSVKNSINVDWDSFKKSLILDCDFYLADLMSVDDMSIRDKLKVVLEKTKYKILRKVESDGLFSFSEVSFKDGQTAYRQFWNKYERPPKPVYQKYILDRHDLLVPQDIREVKGSYYTPEIWVRKAQEYIEKVLGENWQEEYYVWDCAAGTGNLLRGLTNKYNIFASTLDDADVKIMHNAIDEGRLNLVKNNVFQFDFLNDSFDKCPGALRKILADQEKREHLVIFINPPYAEVSSKGVAGKRGVNLSMVHDLYMEDFGTAGRELYIQFLYRVYKEIPGSLLAEFSTLKILQGAAFDGIRKSFQAKLVAMFCVPADTFDNVKGQFPIGFKVWNTSIKEPFSEIDADVFSRSGEYIGQKHVELVGKKDVISNWISKYAPERSSKFFKLGFLCGTNGNSFQHNNIVYLLNRREQMANPRGVWITDSNLFACAIYHAIRHCVEATWLNDRDQFLVPNEGWKYDLSFQTDCLIWAIFNSIIREEDGICHWIPYYEEEVDAPTSFNSRFMADFIHGKIKRIAESASEADLFSEIAAQDAADTAPIDAMSPEAKAVYDAGRELWKYYLSKPGISPNASYYDIRCFFQDRKTDKQGKVSLAATSSDPTYIELWDKIKSAIRALELVIEPKIYEYGFLLK